MWWLLLFTVLSSGAVIETNSWVSSVQTRDTLLQTATVVSTFNSDTYVTLGCSSGSAGVYTLTPYLLRFSHSHSNTCCVYRRDW